MHLFAKGDISIKPRKTLGDWVPTSPSMVRAMFVTIQSQRLGRQLNPTALALLQPLPLGNFAHVILDLLLKRAELFEVAGLGKLRERFHVDDANLSGLGRFLQLLEQFVDLFEFA